MGREKIQSFLLLTVVLKLNVFMRADGSILSEFNTVIVSTGWVWLEPCELLHHVHSKWTAFMWHFSGPNNHSKCFSLVAFTPFTHTHSRSFPLLIVCFLPHTYWYIHRYTHMICKGQFWVHHLPQGHFSMWTEGARLKPPTIWPTGQIWRVAENVMRKVRHYLLCTDVCVSVYI